MPDQLSFDDQRPAPRVTEPLLTAREAATLLSVRPSWIYDAARNGALPCIRLGKHLRFLHSDLERWIDRQRQAS